MTNTFEEVTPNHFRFLTESFDFSLVFLSPTSAVFESNACKVKLTLDRNQVLADVGPSSVPSKWFDLGVITAYLTQKTGAGEWKYEIPKGVKVSVAIEQQISRLAAILEEYLTQIISLFRDKTFPFIEADLMAFWKRRSEELLKT